MLEAAEASGFDFAVVSVTERELEETPFSVYLQPLTSVPETGVFGESWYGRAVYGSAASATRLEEILQIIGGGSFPKDRTHLSNGQRRQLRDAMILEAHIRGGRNIFVTNDERGFIRFGRRGELETRFGIRIMTAEEFVAFCQTLG